jgi:RNA recognition motif-containing protein
MSKNIYVGNLPFSTKDEDLSNIFTPFGEVSSARVIKDRYTERSRGFGFVEMSNDEEADKAITELNGSTVDGRVIKVSEAQPRENRGGGGRGGRGGGGYDRNY